MQRHDPDIKLLRRPTDIAAYAGTQRAILAALWPLLKPGGRLLYATCSVLGAENEAVVASFLETEPGAREEHVAATWGEARQHGGLRPQPGDTGGIRVIQRQRRSKSSSRHGQGQSHHRYRRAGKRAYI